MYAVILQDCTISIQYTFTMNTIKPLLFSKHTPILRSICNLFSIYTNQTTHIQYKNTLKRFSVFVCTKLIVFVMYRGPTSIWNKDKPCEPSEKEYESALNQETSHETWNTYTLQLLLNVLKCFKCADDA